MIKPTKPLGRKAYGSIAHLPGSRLGPSDSHCHEGQEKICTARARDKKDRIIVTEKLDGSNVAIAKVNGSIVALTRAGYEADDSPHIQHHLFHDWVYQRETTWNCMLAEGEVLHGEWLAMAHGTKYRVETTPFVAFDLSRNCKRAPFDHLAALCEAYGQETAHVISDGPPISVADALALLGPRGRHGALEDVEGVVYRVERNGEFDFMAKFVHHDKQDGKYFSDTPVWNWLPEFLEAAQ